MSLLREFSQDVKLHKRVAGIDEAGRGPLAGPVVAACVVLDERVFKSQESWAGVTDSKVLSRKNREKFYNFFIKNSCEIGIGLADHQEVDELNILKASLLAMRRAVENVKSRIDKVFIDGKFIIPLDVFEKSKKITDRKIFSCQEAVIRGDQTKLSIATASIVAKVYRDQLMEEYDQKYPEYNFTQHKGYPTREHCETLKKIGPSPIHRQSFKGVKELV